MGTWGNVGKVYHGSQGFTMVLCLLVAEVLVLYKLKIQSDQNEQRGHV